MNEDKFYYHSNIVMKLATDAELEGVGNIASGFGFRVKGDVSDGRLLEAVSFDLKELRRNVHRCVSSLQLNGYRVQRYSVDAELFE